MSWSQEKHNELTDERTDGRTNDPKAIYPAPFINFETGGGGGEEGRGLKKVRVQLFSILIPYIKFQDPISNRSWQSAKLTEFQGPCCNSFRNILRTIFLY